MGRKIKRVPLNFDWPLKKVWKGYLCPYSSKECPECDGTGYSKPVAYLHHQWYGNVYFRPRMTGSPLLSPKNKAIRDLATRNCGRSPDYYGNSESAINDEAVRLADLFNSRWSYHLDADDVKVLWDEGRLSSFSALPTPEQVNNWAISGWGHDSINAFLCVEAKAKRLGYDPIYCPVCEGELYLYESAEIKKLAEDWQNIEPPVGEGWQVWETISEGSPVSPVFADSDQLMNWLINQGYSPESAKRFIGQGSVPSLMIKNDKFYKDIEMLGE